MIPLLSADQIREIDRATLQEQGLQDHELMWRAASRLFEHLTALLRRKKLEHAPVFVFAGPSNNGGDGLVTALHLLQQAHHKVHVFLLSRTGSASFTYYLKLLEQHCPAQLLTAPSDFPSIPDDAVVIDALFGTGLNRPLQGLSAALVHHLNRYGALRVSIDLPSGLLVDVPSVEPIFQAHVTFTFQLPKLSFLFAENERYVGSWEVVDIGLSKAAIQEASKASSLFMLEKTDVAALLQSRRRFAHKGNFGHALLLAGQPATAGAAILCAQACVRSGAGLTTALIPETIRSAINCSVPEAMTASRELFEAESLSRYTTLAAGPGMGVDPASEYLLKNVLRHAKGPVVLDADALTLLSRNPMLWDSIPYNSILTPHPGEFNRLTPPASHWLEQLQQQRNLSMSRQCIVVLKGAFTRIATPEGKVYFNPTGNHGMAKGGSGDVLTGMLAALLAQGYTPEHAALLGVFLHGLAGDLAAQQSGTWAMTASDLISFIGPAFKHLASSSD
ncbi:MAG: NAD(P)H-hydrate dehydratase [Chitinophagales bacterium]|nr:NAD(P)H-hydrate dehydratase [Chitinophagales bacterium]MDW8428796.1 NAD(P)H-hydrate dehydratase [Chitinophagales bacterium]